MTKRILPDRPLTGLEKTRRYQAAHPKEYQDKITRAGKKWRAANRTHYNQTHREKMARLRSRIAAAQRSLKKQARPVSDLELGFKPLFEDLGAVAQHRLPLEGVRRSADYAWPDLQVAVFIDGCWWHGCPDHWAPPRSNTEFWAAKVAKNQARDRDTSARLGEAGWLVLRFWEHATAVEMVDWLRALIP